MRPDLNRYIKKFDPQGFWKFVRNKALRAGQQIVYMALLLYYAYQRKETPRWAKMVIAGALGYLLAPVDGIPDLTPVLGYTDDLGVLSFALVTVSGYINHDVKADARRKLHQWFPSLDEKSLDPVDKQF